MIAPIYPEAGGSATVAPSPMTLSRWDTQSTLYAFSNKSTPYQKAFFHPGIGLWQFDSAGGWNLTASDAINTQIAAPQAAATMAQRWCASGSRSYVWAPWYGCGASVCEGIYNEIFDGISLRPGVMALTAEVGRKGGMVTRQCLLDGTPVTCSYVDPAAAQGNRSWASTSSSIPTPISAPFYVVNLGGREHRVWLAQDSGYGVTISANKPVTGNARSSLVWSTSTVFCDQTTGRGSCGPQARVAVTSWGNRSENPFGSLDGVTPGTSSLELGGWAIDPDTNNPISVHLYVDGTFREAVTANRSRPDLAPHVPGYGDQHGFTRTVDGLAPGSHEVCAFAINVGPFGNTHPPIGCATATVPQEPFGSFDTADASVDGVRIRGWVIDPDTTANVTIRTSVDGVYASSHVADKARPDVDAAYPGRGTNHGFDAVVASPPGIHTVCVRAVNLAAGSFNPRLGCRTVDVPNADPFGSLDQVSREGASVRVKGWAIDPNTASPISVHIYGNDSFKTAVVADASRPDVDAAFGKGAAHGFNTLIAAPPGPIKVCVFAINVGPGIHNSVLGCRSI